MTNIDWHWPHECKWDFRDPCGSRYKPSWRKHRDHLVDRLDAQERRIVAQEKRIQEILEGIGGAVWRTAEGHARGIAFLSSEHLRNIIAWPTVGGRMSALCQEELNRRSIDEAWRKGDALIVALAKKIKAKRKPAKRRRK